MLTVLMILEIFRGHELFFLKLVPREKNDVPAQTTMKLRNSEIQSTHYSSIQFCSVSPSVLYSLYQ